MPPPAGNSTKKKKKGRAPKHQNTFAFKHNPGSKKTEKILSSPNVGVCKRCFDKIEWRKKYRKVCVFFFFSENSYVYRYFMMYSHYYVG